MIVEPTDNKEFIKCFLTIPEIFATIAEDGAKPEDYEPDTDNSFWLMVSDDDTVVGLFRLHPLNSTTLHSHAHVLPAMRKQYSDKAGKAIMQWFVNDCPDNYQKLQASVPDVFKNVIAYLERNGFKKEGVSRKSVKKYGKIIDMHNYGITRDEAREVI